MVNEMFTHTKHRVKVTRPKPVYLWTSSDVQIWYRRHCSEYLSYIDNFSKIGVSLTLNTPVVMIVTTIIMPYCGNEITGRALLRITDHSLLRMGISNYRDREAIWREIVKQRLKTDFMEIRDMERMDNSAH